MKLTDITLADVMSKLASSEPTPGGGSAAALSGALGVSLLQMVCNLTKGRKKFADHEELMEQTIEKCGEIGAKLLEAIDNDARAYDEVSAAYKMAKDSDEEKATRSTVIQKALKTATLSPFDILNLSHDALTLAQAVCGKTNPNAASDLGVCAKSLKTAMDGAWMNILINVGSIKDEAFVADIKEKSTAALRNAYEISNAITSHVITEIS